MKLPYSPEVGLLSPSEKRTLGKVLPENEQPVILSAGKQAIKLGITPDRRITLENTSRDYLPFILVTAPSSIATAVQMPWAQILGRYANGPEAIFAKQLIKDLKSGKAK